VLTLLLRRRSNVTNDFEFLVEYPEEGYDDEDDTMAPRTLTLMRMSVAFSSLEAGLRIIIVYIITCIYSQKYLQSRSYCPYCNACYGG
jgi:hypothetical protein